MRRLLLPLLPLLLSLHAFAETEVPPPDATSATTPATDATNAAPATTDAPATTTAAPAHDATTTTAPASTSARAWRKSPTAGIQIEGARDGVPDCRDGAAACWKNDRFALWPRLRLRAGYEFVQQDSQILFVGGNDGFFLDQTRIGFDGAFRDDVRFRLILDVVSLLPGQAPNAPVQSFTAAARDAWVAWTPSDFFTASVGQQFMPVDVEGGSTLAALPFARRSVATSGVRFGHGIVVAGLSPSRQTGLVLSSTDRARLGSVGLEYALGVSNGNGQNVLGNDNKLPAAYARVGASYEDMVRFAVGARYNPRTTGTLPNLYNETDAVGFADLQLSLAGVDVVAQGIYRQTSFDTLVPDPAATGGSENALGATAWIAFDKPFGVDLGGVIPAYRFSYYDPSSAFADDQLMENTLGARWNVPVDGLPLSVFLDATVLTETGTGVRDLDNVRVTSLVQLEL